MNGVKVTYPDNSFLVRDNIFEFSDKFINFFINLCVTYGNIEKDEKLKDFC